MWHHKWSNLVTDSSDKLNIVQIYYCYSKVKHLNRYYLVVMVSIYNNLRNFIL